MIKEIKLPEIAENVHVVTLVDLRVSAGDKIEKDQPVFDVETDKAAVEIPSPFSGIVKEIYFKVGDQINVGDVILTMETDVEESANSAGNKEILHPEKKEEPEIKSEKQTIKTPDILKTASTVVPKKEVPASPSVRMLARELGVNIYEVPGSGKDNRILDEDVKNYAKKIITERSSVFQAGVEIELPDFTKWGEIEKKPMSRVRELTAQNMSMAWRNIPHVFQFGKADISSLEDFRKKYSAMVEKKGGKMTMTALLVKLVSVALKQFPAFNASIDLKNNEIIYKKYIHIGIAVDTDRGLLVPVIKDADKKSIIDISVELTELAKKTRDKKISPDELDGGTFTISNLGGIGGTSFTPIVYSPQVAILGVSKAAMEQVWSDNKFKPKLMMPLTLSYDHRAIDGADGARFLTWLCEVIEFPLEILL